MSLDLIDEVVAQSLQVVGLEELQDRASLHKLIDLIADIGEPTYLEHFQMSKSFRSLAFGFVTVDEIVHALVTNVLAASQNKSMKLSAHPNSNHQMVVDLLTRIEG